MANLTEINGRKVSEIMRLETRQVRAAGRVWMAKHDPERNSVYLMDEFGNLTGQEAIVRLDKPVPQPTKEAPAPEPTDPKVSVETLPQSDLSPKKKRVPRATSQKQQKRSELTKEQKEAARIARRAAKSSQKKASHVPQETKAKTRFRFHPGYFFAGMIVVLLGMAALYLVRLGVYEGLL